MVRCYHILETRPIQIPNTWPISRILMLAEHSIQTQAHTQTHTLNLERLNVFIEVLNCLLIISSRMPHISLGIVHHSPVLHMQWYPRGSPYFDPSTCTFSVDPVLMGLARSHDRSCIKRLSSSIRPSMRAGQVRDTLYLFCTPPSGAPSHGEVLKYGVCRKQSDWPELIVSCTAYPPKTCIYL